MKDRAHLLRQIMWPPLAPVLSISRQDNGEKYWVTLCALLVVPFGAVFHHALFYSSQCMLNPFGEAYYIGSVLLRWLQRDPSLPWAIVAAVAIYHIGKRHEYVRVLVAPLFVAFLPLSIWIWDIPLTGRFICDHLHDDKLIVFGQPVRTTYFYVIGLAMYLLFLLGLVRRNRLEQRAGEVRNSRKAARS